MVIDGTIVLRALLKKGSDASVLRDMVGFAAHRLMKLETEARCGSAHGERSPERMCSAESFNGKLRDELLNMEVFNTLAEARVLIPTET